MCEGKVLELSKADRMHRPLRLGRPEAQCDRQQAARFQERDELAECPRPVAWRDVHPNRAKGYQIEADSEAHGRLERWQPVIEPSNAQATIGTGSDFPHPGRWLYRDHVIALCGEPAGVTSHS